MDHFYRYKDRRSHDQIKSYFLNLALMLEGVLKITREYEMVDLQVALVIYEWVTGLINDSQVHHHPASLRPITDPQEVTVLHVDEFNSDKFSYEHGMPDTNFTIYVPDYSVTTFTVYQKLMGKKDPRAFKDIPKYYSEEHFNHVKN